MTKLAGGGGWTCRPPAIVEDRQPLRAGGLHTPGLVTVTSRGLDCWGAAARLTINVMVLPSAATVGAPSGVTSPTGPAKLTVAPGENRPPLKVSWTWLVVLGFVVMLLGSTAASTGVVTAKVRPLLTRPLAATVTLPVVAGGGTVTVTDDDVLPVTVPGTRTLFAPAKVADGALPKPEPLTVTLLPIGPAAAERPLTVGGGGGGGGFVFLGGGASWHLLDPTLTIPTPVAEPPSGLVTLTSDVVSGAALATPMVAVTIVSLV